jgi:hypothetical protein
MILKSKVFADKRLGCFKRYQEWTSYHKDVGKPINGRWFEPYLKFWVIKHTCLIAY